MSSQGGLSSVLPEPGAVIGGKYNLIKKLSEGGGGIVWEAAAPRGNSVALKFLKWASLNKSMTLATERFKNEFAILKSLSHPNISEIYDFGLDADTGLYFFTTEYLTSGDLKSMVGAPVPVLEELLLEALRALEYLRGNKLLHLDLKPQNLLLRHDGKNPELALIDFGLAGFRSPARPGGTVNYMPPEMIVMRLDMNKTRSQYPPPDHRSDLYSLGVTFYYCLTGVQPFCEFTLDKKIDTLATLNKHLKYTPPPPSSIRKEVPPYLDRVIMKLIARHPDDRFPSAIIAAQAIQYASPAAHAPESAKTLLAYLPKAGKLIGRHGERKIIEESLRSVAAGVPHAAPVICIAGGRGSGKTRLMMSAKPFAQQNEMNVAVVENEEDMAGLSRTSQTNLILIDDLDLHLESADDPILLKTRTLIKNLSLQQKLKDAPGPRACLIFTLNEDRCDLKRAMMDLNLDETVCHTVRLKNFTTSEVSEYLTALLGETPDPSVVDQLKNCTDGNPLFITEHLEEMIAKGMLFSLAGRPDAKTLKTIGIDFSQTPPSKSLADTVAQQLEHLSEDARNLAVLLASWHRPVSIDEIRETSGVRTASHKLLLLVSAGLLRRNTNDGRFMFSNALTAGIICGRTDPEILQIKHDIIARYLMRQRRVDPDELDIHMAYGTRTEKRLPALARLAVKAIEDHEPLHAARHLETLLKILPKKSLKSRADVLTQLGHAYENARRYDDAKASYSKIKQLKTPPDLKREFHIRANERLGLMHMRRRELTEARRFFTAALKYVRRSHLMALWGLKLENYLASVDMRNGRLEEAIERFEHSAIAAKKKLKPADRRELTNNELGEACLRSGDIRRALAILNQDLSAAKRAMDIEKMASFHYLIGDALRHDDLKNYVQALKHYQESLKLARAHRMVKLEVRVHNGIGNLNLKLSRPDKALLHYREGLKLAQQIEGETTSVELMIGMGLAAQQMHKPDGVIEYFEAALDFSKGPRGAFAGLIRRFSPTIYVSLGDAYYQKKDLAKAETYLSEAMSLDKKKRLSPDIRYSLYGTLVELYLERGDIKSADSRLPLLKTISDSFPPAKKHFKELSKRVRCHG